MEWHYYRSLFPLKYLIVLERTIKSWILWKCTSDCASPIGARNFAFKSKFNTEGNVSYNIWLLLNSLMWLSPFVALETRALANFPSSVYNRSCGTHTTSRQSCKQLNYLRSVAMACLYTRIRSSLLHFHVVVPQLPEWFSQIVLFVFNYSSVFVQIYEEEKSFIITFIFCI